MAVKLIDGTTVYYLIDVNSRRPGGCRPVRFSAMEQAEQFLASLARHPDNKMQLHRAAASDRSVYSRELSAKEIVSVIVRKMRGGQFVLLEEVDLLPEPSAPPVPTPTPPKVSATLPPREKDVVWVAFIVVEDATGLPLSEVQLETTLPDGTVQTGQTDARGLLRYSDIMAGACTVTSPFGIVSHETTLRYLGSGRRQGDPPGNVPPVESKSDAGELPGPLNIVKPESLALTREFSLDDVASANGISWEDIALFNWGISDRAFVDEAIEDMLGDATGVFGDSNDEFDQDLDEDPDETIDGGNSSEDEKQADPPSAADGTQHLAGEMRSPKPKIFVPVPWEIPNLATGHEHIIRVRSARERYYVSLLLHDEELRGPLANKRYTLKGPDGETFEGTTDAEGFLEHEVDRLAYFELTVDDVHLRAPLNQRQENQQPGQAPSDDDDDDSIPSSYGDDDKDAFSDLEFDFWGDVGDDDSSPQTDYPQAAVTVQVPATPQNNRRHAQRVPFVVNPDAPTPQEADHV